jgi:Flp pilus assembly protein TadG
MLRGKRRSGNNRRGSSMVEVALIMPWYIFLFFGAYDFGFIAYGMVATQNAARVTAMHCSGSSSLASNCNANNTACNYALDQLRNMPNVGSSMVAPCSSPIVITTSMVTSVDGTNAAQVTVAYTTPTLVPIPGIFPGTFTISRTVTMKVLT